MSIERELLERVVSGDDDGDFFISHRLYKDIETFLAQPKQDNIQYLLDQVARLTAENAMIKEKWLAQPEQTEHWKETLIEHFQTAFDSEMYRTDEGEELILLEDAICYVEEFAPPKREPLSDEKLEIMYSKHAFAMDKQEYMWGFRDAERTHGIGGGNEY